MSLYLLDQFQIVRYWALFVYEAQVTPLVLFTKSWNMLSPGTALWFATGSGNDFMNNAITFTSVVGNVDKK